MSLGAWVKDYIYIPLGGSREGELKRTRNVMLAMLFTGLWHGTGWTFIVWGCLHGLMLAVNHWWRRHGVKLPAILSWLITFLCVVLCWVVFRAESLSDAGKILAAMVDVKNIALPYKLGRYMNFLANLGISFVPFKVSAKYYVYIFVYLALILSTPNAWQFMDRFKPSKLWLIIVSILAVMSLVKFSGVSDFLYFQF